MPLPLHNGSLKSDPASAWPPERAFNGPAVFGFLLPFSIVLYIALRGGGFDDITRSEFGFVLWWAIVLGSAVGLLSTTGLRRSAWTLLGLFAVYVLWTGLSIIWTDSTDRTVVE